VLHVFYDVGPLACAEVAIHPGYDTLDLLAITLAQAARGQEELAGALVLGQGAQGVVRFFSRGLDEAAGVDQKEVGAVVPLRVTPASVQQQVLHGLGVDGVLGATQRQQVKALAHG